MKSLSQPQTLRAMAAALALALAVAPAWGQSDVRAAKAVATPALQSSLPALSDLPAPTLPGMALVQNLERDAPRVQAGQSALDAAKRQGEALRAGPQEFTGRVQTQSRRIDSGPTLAATPNGRCCWSAPCAGRRRPGPMTAWPAPPNAWPP
jgi:hypothetical protein